MEKEKIYFQAIVSNFEPPHRKVLQLYKKYRSFKRIFEVLEKDFKIKKDWEKEYQKLKDLGGEIILRKDLSQELKRIKEPVLGLFILGKLNLNFPLKIAIVGTRKASNLGKKIAFDFAKNLAEIGILIISGLAYGIDEASHRGTLEAKKPTMAIIGCGLDLILKDPRKNLVEKILENNGVIISEYPLGSPALAHHFPLRNRLIAGLADGVLIIEATINSGSLITARYGLEFGKEIFAIPGIIYDKNYEGSLRLIQQGAKLVIEPEDILKEFDFKLPQKIKSLSLSPKERIIIEILKNGACNFSELLENSKMPANEILSLLSHLEIKGVVFNQGGRFYLSK